VTEPIKLHVAAKRYLCKVDQQYSLELSSASILSLELQSGPLNWAEVSRFEKNPYYKRAVQLRRWDDKAKVPNLEVAGLQQYREILLRCLKTQ
jgi:predicted HD phosphohydrolase